MLAASGEWLREDQRDLLTLFPGKVSQTITGTDKDTAR